MVYSRLKLTPNDIYSKDFKTSMRGYHQDEVNEFLDMIIQDYETFKTEFDKLQREVKLLKQNSHPVEHAKPGYQQVNYDVLKRLSNLEKAVFGRQSTAIEE